MAIKNITGVKIEPAGDKVTNPKDQTIKDFGEQWLRYRDNEGYYGSVELFSDILSPFLKPDEIKGCKVAEIGSGTGRIVNMLLEAGAKHVVALEPSEAFEVLCQNIQQPEKVACLNITGEQLPAYGNLDYVFCIGVLHHIVNPKPVIRAAFDALRPGGHFFVWLYGKEGNELYLTFLKPIRIFTKHVPHFVLSALVEIMYWPLVLYAKLCRMFLLPMQGYLLAVFEKMPPDKKDSSFMINLNRIMQSITHVLRLKNYFWMGNSKMSKFTIVINTAGQLSELNPNPDTPLLINRHIDSFSIWRFRFPEE